MELVVVQPTSQAGRTAPLGKRALLIGRSPACQICAGAPGVSRVHCVVYLRDERPFAVDLGSTYGTLVNGERIGGETELSEGDVLQIGRLQLRVSADAEAQPIPVDDEDVPELDVAEVDEPADEAEEPADVVEEEDAPSTPVPKSNGSRPPRRR